MPGSSYESRRRRWGLYGSIVLAVGMVFTVAWVMVTDDPVYEAEDIFPEPVHPDFEKQPRFVFPDELRTTDLSLNRFIDRFFRVCTEARYSQVRLMLSTRSGETLLPKDFESLFNVIKEARILGIRRLPDSPEQEGPVYLLKVIYDLEEYAPKHRKTGNTTHLAIAREDGQWRIGPMPSGALARLEAYEASRNRVAASEGSKSDAPSRPEPEAEQTPVNDVPKTTANRPVRIDS